MPGSFVISVGPEAADIVGCTNREIQQAVDRAAERGGGTVQLLAGTYDMADSLHLRSGVRVVGEGQGTVLRKAPSVSSALSADLGYGHYDVSLADPDLFTPGMGVHIHDDRSGGFYDTVATLTWREGDRFGITRMLVHDYGRQFNARASSLFPVISGYDLEGASVEDLSIDGNKEQNAPLNGCRGGGVFLLQAHNVALRRLRIVHYNGDGISFQQCRNALVEACRLEGMTGLGLHPGSGSTGAILRGNVCRGNGSDGIFYCLRVSYSLCQGNTIENNGGYGISIGQRDTEHLVRGNTIRHNARAGVYFREADEVMAGSRNLLEGNRLEGNCLQEGLAEIEIAGGTRDVQIVGNVLRPVSREGRTPAAVHVGPAADRIVYWNNQVTLEAGAAVCNLAAPEAISTERPTGRPAVGPERLPAAGARHLGETAGA